MPAGNVVVNVTFKKQDYTITVETGDNGTATVSSETAAEGEEITVTATPEEGYVVDKITYTVDGSEDAVDITDAGKFTMPAGNVTVSVTFKKQEVPVTVTQYTVTYVLDGGTLDGQTGSVTVTVDAGTVITLPTPTKDGYTFDYWEGSRYNAGDNYTVNEDHTFTAVWKSNPAADQSEESPKTGDESHIGLWTALMCLSLAGLVVILLFGRKKRYQSR